MTEQIYENPREEQIKRTREHLYQVHGLTNGGITGTLKSIYYLTFGFFTNYRSEAHV